MEDKHRHFCREEREQEDRLYCRNPSKESFHTLCFGLPRMNIGKIMALLSILALGVLMGDVCAARNLDLQSGKSLQDVHLLRRGSSKVSIRHKTGGGAYAISDFNKEGQDWIRSYRFPRTVGGIQLYVDADVAILASDIVKHMSSFPSLQTSLAVKLDALSRGEVMAVPRIDSAGILIRKQLLWELLVSEMPKNLLDSMHEHMHSEFWEKYVEAARRAAPELQSMLDLFIRDNEELRTEYIKRINGKAKSTSLNKLEIKKIIRELESQLEPEERRLMRRYLTLQEFEDIKAFHASNLFMKVSRIKLKTEYKMVDLTRRFDLFALPRSSDTPLRLAALTRLEKGALLDAYGVTVHDDMNEEGFFPDYWHKPPLLVHSLPLEPTMAYLTVPLVREFLMRYPSHIIRSNLSDIYLMERFELYGKWYGGTYQSSSIYGAVGQCPHHIMNTLHHEFSSILIRNYDFPEGKWNAINDPNWEYVGTGIEMLGLPGLNRQTEEMLAQGFLTRYSQSSHENDINVMIEWVTGRPDDLKKIAARHEKIRKKYDLLERFYSAVLSGKRPRKYIRTMRPPPRSTP